jgi:predicted transcriptional regulator
VTATPSTPPRTNALGLGRLEAAIMAVAWQPGYRWLTIPAIRDRLDYPPASYSSVAAVVASLHRKGLLTRRDGPTPARQYQPAHPVDEHTGHLIAALLDAAADPRAAVACALRHPVPTPSGQPYRAPAAHPASIPAAAGTLVCLPGPAGHGRDAS